MGQKILWNDIDLSSTLPPSDCRVLLTPRFQPLLEDVAPHEISGPLHCVPHWFRSDLVFTSDSKLIVRSSLYHSSPQTPFELSKYFGEPDRVQG